MRARAAAATAVCLLTAAAIVVLRHAGTTQATAPHDGHDIKAAKVPAAVSTPPPLPRTSWTVTADSGAGTATAALDGDPGTAWQATAPHWITIDTHNRVSFSGLTYLPAAGGRIGRYRLQTSDNGTTWGAPVATGTFADDALLKTVTINTVLTRFVRLTVLTTADPLESGAGAAEINLLGGTDPVLSRRGWTIAADNQETTDEAADAVDGSIVTIWHTDWRPTPAPALPHRITIDMHRVNLVSGLSYLPRQSGTHGRIGKYRVETSMDNRIWAPVAADGTWPDSAPAKTVTFPPQLARYVRLTALTEAGGRGPWSSAAELNLLGRADPTMKSGGRQLIGKHTLTVRLPSVATVGGLSYRPRHGRWSAYRITYSIDGSVWSSAMPSGRFGTGAALQTVVFPPVRAKYVRITVGSGSGTADVKLLGASGSMAAGLGSWGAPIGFPLVPVAAAVLPDGKLLTWSSSWSQAGTGGTGHTLTATYDPVTGVVTQREVSETGHDMFCPGISMLPDGRVLVTGGNDSHKTSIYDPATGAWTAGPPMTTPRGYQSSVTLGDGRVFTIGGSWSGGKGGLDTAHKSGEVWSARTGWTALPGADVVPMLTADTDPRGDYRKDNQAWLFAWTGGRILQAGPSRAMNWYTADGSGSVAPAGPRGNSRDAMNGSAVMYDTGKILTLGGAPDYENATATADAYVLTINSDNTVRTRRVASMANARTFQNSVVLPDGKVLVTGGENYGVPYSDNSATLAAEIWDPATERFTTLAAETMARTYHSIAALLPDGRVFSGGGGLCGTKCTTNHLDGQVFSPPYLFDADGKPAARPVITGAPTRAGNGEKITVTTDRPVSAFSIVRTGTVTHTVDTDQRRLSLVPAAVPGGGYELTVPADSGVAVPGYWMLFALDAKGVPSTAQMIRIGG